MTTTFVSSGLPENRSQFMTKVSDKDENFEDSDEEVEDKELVKIEGREGLFARGLSMQEQPNDDLLGSNNLFYEITLLPNGTVPYPTLILLS